MGFTKKQLEELMTEQRILVKVHEDFIKECENLFECRNAKYWKRSEIERFIDTMPLFKEQKSYYEAMKKENNIVTKQELKRKYKLSKNDPRLLFYGKTRIFHKFRIIDDEIYRISRNTEKYLEDFETEFNPADGERVIAIEDAFDLIAEFIVQEEVINDNVSLSFSEINKMLSVHYHGLSEKLVSRFLTVCTEAYTEKNKSGSENELESEPEESSGMKPEASGEGNDPEACGEGKNPESSGEGKNPESSGEENNQYEMTQEKEWTDDDDFLVAKKSKGKKTVRTNKYLLSSTDDSSSEDDSFVKRFPKTSTKKKSIRKKKGTGSVSKSGLKKKKDTKKHIETPGVSDGSNKKDTTSKTNIVSTSEKNRSYSSSISVDEDADDGFAISDVAGDSNHNDTESKTTIDTTAENKNSNLSSNKVDDDDDDDIVVSQVAAGDSNKNDTGSSTNMSSNVEKSSSNSSSSSINSNRNKKGNQSDSGSNDQSDIYNSKESGGRGDGNDHFDSNHSISESITTYIKSLGNNVKFHSIALYMFCVDAKYGGKKTIPKNLQRKLEIQTTFVLMVIDLATAFCWFEDCGHVPNNAYLVMEKLGRIFGIEGYPSTISYFDSGRSFNEERYYQIGETTFDYDFNTPFGNQKYKKEYNKTSIAYQAEVG